MVTVEIRNGLGWINNSNSVSKQHAYYTNFIFKCTQMFKARFGTGYVEQSHKGSAMLLFFFEIADDEMLL
jgi:hypothetical protein